MQLSSVIFQEKIWKEMQSAILSNRWPQSAILLGDSGYGGFLVAMNIAKLHFCTNISDSFCNTCKDCMRINSLSHPNLDFLIPTIGKQTVEEVLRDWKAFILEHPFAHAIDWMEHLNSATTKPNINSLNTRTFIRSLNTSALESKSKIAIIWQADYLMKEGNILLKSIEEPPENTKILILANRKEQILPTILSRSQNFQLIPLTTDKMMEAFGALDWLQGEKAMEIAQLSYGSMHEASRLLNAELDEIGEFFVQYLRNAFRGNPLDLRNLIEKGTKEGKNTVKSSFEFGLKYVREMMYYLYSDGSYQIKLNAKLKLSAEKLSSILDLAKLDELRKEINQIILSIDRNANLKILLFNAGLNIHYLLKRNI